MAISYVQGTKTPTSYPGVSTNTDTCTIAKPTGTTTGDFMIAFLTAGGVTISAPAGWTELDSFAHASGNFRNSVFYRVAGASEGTNYTFTASANTTPFCGAMSTFRGVDTSNPFAGTHQSSSTTGTDTVSNPSITTTSTSVIINFRCSREDSGSGSTITSEPTFTTTGWTTRLSGGNRGSTVAYGQRMVTDAVVPKAPGTWTGASFDANDVITHSIERTIALTASGADVDASPTAVVSVSVTANNPTITKATRSAAATLTPSVTSNASNAAVGASAAAISLSVTANGATVSTANMVNASAPLASASVTAPDATGGAAPPQASPSASSAANQPVPGVGARAVQYIR